MKTRRNSDEVVVGGVRYKTASALYRDLGVSRQTLWRWRREGVIPPGSKFRDGILVFREDEVARIRMYAERIVPASPASPESEGAER